MIECLLCSIANVYYLQANYPEALKMHEDVLAIRVAKFGLEHPLVADTKNKYVCIYGYLACNGTAYCPILQHW